MTNIYIYIFIYKLIILRLCYSIMNINLRHLRHLKIPIFQLQFTLQMRSEYQDVRSDAS